MVLDVTEQTPFTVQYTCQMLAVQKFYFASERMEINSETWEPGM